MQISIKTNFPQVQKALDQLREDIADKATARAINRTMEQAKTDMGREIRKEFVLTADEVRAQLRVVRASFKGGRLFIQAALIGGRPKGRSLNLIRFVEQKAGKRELAKRKKAEGEKPQLRFKIKRAGGAQVIPGAFIGNKGRTVFIRQGPKRLPVKALRTIDVAQMFNARRINSVVTSKIREKFPVIFAREAAFYLRKFRGG